MKKMIKKIVSIFLSFCLLISASSVLFTTNASADDTLLYGDITVDFENFTGNFIPITGEYGGIDWGNSEPQWNAYNATQGLETENVFINAPKSVYGAAPVSKTIILPAGTVLKSLKMTGNDQYDTGTVTLSSDGNKDVVASVNTNQLVVINTGWTIASASVTITVDNSADGRNGTDYVQFDDFTYGPPPDVTVDFENFTGNFIPITGEYGGIDWGNSEPHWNAYNATQGLETENVFINAPKSVYGTAPVSKTIILPAGTVLKSLKMTGNDQYDTGTVTLSSEGNNDVVVSVNTNQLVVINTGWTNASSTVTITVDNSSDGRNGTDYVQFDDFTYGSPYYSEPEPSPSPTPVPTEEPLPITPTPVPIETVDIKDEGMTFDSCDANEGAWQTPIFTYNDCIYSVYLNASRDMMIAKKDATGNVTTHTITTNCRNDVYHTAPSVVVDTQGYIHVTGNMHVSPFNNDPANPYKDYAWQYWVSNNPEDISAFTFKGDGESAPPGCYITYARFFTDNNGVIYLTSRQGVDDLYPKYYARNSMTVGLARYDVSTKKWTALGGNNYAGTIYNTKSIFWTNKDSGDCYDCCQTEIYFDKNNRMHIASMMQDYGAGAYSGYGGTQVAYAYSDDGGETFYKADGTQYTTLPATHDTADIVVGRPWSTLFGNDHMMYSEGLGIGEGPEGITVTFTRNTTRAYYSRWDGQSWTAPAYVPLTLYTPVLATDSNSVLTGFGSGYLLRSPDGWKTCNKFSTDTGSTANRKFDSRYAAQTGKIRYQVMTSDRKVKVYTATFSPIVVTPTPMPDTITIDELSGILDYGAANTFLTGDGVFNSLKVKVDNVVKNKDDAVKAVNSLNALKNEVSAQSGKKLETGYAALLLGYINNLIKVYKEGGSKPEWYSEPAFASVKSLGTANTGTVTTEFDVIPLENNIDGVIGYTDTDITVSANGDMAICIWMNPEGYFQAMNGGWPYTSLDNVKVYYTAGSTYHVKMTADMTTKKFDVWVTPPGGQEIMIAQNYAFRSTAASTDDLGKICLMSPLGSNLFKIVGHTPPEAQ